ncbi:MAG: CAP domain-containing protein [Methylococcaceae bacterium]
MLNPKIIIMLGILSSTFGWSAVAAPLSVDTNKREASRNFYNGVYRFSSGIPAEWQGDISLCDAGRTAQSFTDATLLRVNYYRAMAGIPAQISFNDEFNTKALLASVMMSANQQLSHHPTEAWLCHTPAGIEAAGNSNLALGSTGPKAIDDLMFDWGDNNAAVGHRRWILFPGTRVMGVGNIEPPTDSEYPATQALWIIDEGAWTRPRPSTRDGFVSWPPPGYTPRGLIPDRWSFAWPDADFSQATVTVQSEDSIIPTTLEPLSEGFGDNTLAWVTDLSARPTTQDARYSVTIDNVRIQGKAQRFEYAVIFFDPDQTGKDTVLPTITKGLSRIKAGTETRYAMRKVPGATNYQWFAVHATAFNTLNGAESGLGDLTPDPTLDDYPHISNEVHASGQNAYHLAQTDQQTRSLIFSDFLVPTARSSLQFMSRLGWATEEQSADVDISTDEGRTWTTLYHQSGTHSAGETAFNRKTVNLSAYANRIIRLRFHYGSERRFYPQTQAGVGWYLDNIRLSRVFKADENPTPQPAKANQFTYSPPAPGQYFLSTRALMFKQYPLEWTRLKPITVLSE